jgi:uncharacterized membrane-anchored protein YjiN (DUF445 family)
MHSGSSELPSAPSRSHLARAQRLALGLLLLFVALFVVSSLAPRSLWTDGLKAVAEAAMVGALADWFAVVALFRRPLGLPIPHTAVIPANKDRIGENLAGFVRDKFLDPDSLVALLRRNDPATQLAQWLADPANADLLGQQAARLLAAVLDTVQDARIERFLRQALRTLIGRLDLSQTLATAVAALTQGGRHQALLDEAIQRLIRTLQDEDTRVLIAQTIVHWLKQEHPLKEKVLPTEWLGEQGSDLVANALQSLLAEVAANPGHVLRAQFDAAVRRFVRRLQTDPAWARKATEIRDYLRGDPAVGRYVQELWQGARAALLRDLAQEDSAVARQVRLLGAWLGRSLAADAALREALNQRLERWAQGLAPDVSRFVAQHIRDTVQRWDAQELSRLIELHIGRDLQYIRVNGTVVGGLIGLVLFGLTHAAEIVRRALG